MKEQRAFGKSPSLKTFHKGKTIGGHRIISEIGRGGMDMVYKALDSSRNRYVALKVLSPSLQANLELLKRLHHEADAAWPHQPS